MAETHPSFRQPADTMVPVWRYTDLSKFVWMLQKKALYFSRADLLGDPYEGYVTRRMALEGPLSVIAQLKAEIEKSGGEFGEKEMEMAKWTGEQMFRVNARRIMFVNCWHMSKHESAAMWKLYTPDNHSICIRSTYQELWNCLPEKLCYLGEVTYLDYDSELFDHGNMLNLVLHKRTSFAHEREVRAVIMDGTALTGEQEPPTHKVINVDLKALIQDVYIGPTALPPLRDVVQNLLDQVGFDIEVKQSGLNAPPAY
jgi:hypothetical protein